MTEMPPECDDETVPDRPWPGAEPPVLLKEDLDHALVWAARANVSDIMLMTDEPIIARIDGVYRRVSGRRLRTREIGDLVIVMGENNSMSRVTGGEPVDMTYEVYLDRTTRYRYRVSATQGAGAFTSKGVDVTLRVAPGKPPTTDDLHVEDDILRAWDDITASQGLFIMVGATGTGKTSTLSALLGRTLQQPPGRKIITYEAPIEHNLSEVDDKVGTVVQTQVPDDVRSFEIGVANALRRAPNVILIGESRDQATINGTVLAALTGHAVATTLHASSVAAAMPRLVGVFPARDQPAVLGRVLDVCRGIVTQRLVPRVGGGRVALREYLFLDADLRDRLMRESTDRIQPAMHEVLASHGWSLLDDAKKKFDLGLIRQSELDLVASEQSRAHK